MSNLNDESGDAIEDLDGKQSNKCIEIFVWIVDYVCSECSASNALREVK